MERRFDLVIFDCGGGAGKKRGPKRRVPAELAGGADVLHRDGAGRPPIFFCIRQPMDTARTARLTLGPVAVTT